MTFPQRGNILFLILLAIILFAALAYAVSSGMRGDGKSASPEKAQAAASEFIQYATLMGNTINRLMLANDCKDTQISFENPIVTTYMNASAPARCKLFDPAGGGMAFKALPTEWLSPTFSAEYDYGYWAVFDQQSLQDVGLPTSDTANNGVGIDLVMLVPYLSEAMCLAINNMTGVKTIPFMSTRIAAMNDSRHFKGTYWSLNAGYIIPPKVLPNYGCQNVILNNGLQVYTGYFLLLAR